MGGGGKKTVSAATAVWNALRHAIGEEKGERFTFLGIFTSAKKAFTWAKKLADGVKSWAQNHFGPFIDLIKKLWDIWDKKIKPILDEITTTIQDIKFIIGLIKKRTEYLEKYIKEEVLQPLYQLRDEVKAITNKLAQVAGLIDSKIADRIRAFGEEVDEKLVGWWEKAVDYVNKTLDNWSRVLEDKVVTIKTVIEGEVNRIDEAMRGLAGLAGLVIEPTGNLTRESEISSEALWGKDLFYQRQKEFWSDFHDYPTEVEPEAQETMPPEEALVDVEEIFSASVEEMDRFAKDTVEAILGPWRLQTWTP